ncbi:MAG: DUF3581 family protein [Pseudomonadota bacterium]
MLIDQFYSDRDGKLCFTNEQGSQFAKHIAGDFNPIHDADSRRFCVPGDLLFAVILSRYGLSQHMEFRFTGMVDETSELLLPAAAQTMTLSDGADKEYLSVTRGGDTSTDSVLIDELIKAYVSFSGHSFPDLLVPLLASHNVMINPARPMVFYESMVIDLDRLDLREPTLEEDSSQAVIDGKRGAARFSFTLMDAGKVVGRGQKRMVIGGLREYDEATMSRAIDEYKRLKQQYLSDEASKS